MDGWPAQGDGKILSGMMLWEAYLENTERFPGIEAAREQFGTLEVRGRFLRLIDAAETVFYHAADAGYGMSFDFDFSEDFLALLTDATNEDCADSAPMLRITKADYEAAGKLIAMRERVMRAGREIENGLMGLCGPYGPRPTHNGKVWPSSLADWPSPRLCCTNQLKAEVSLSPDRLIPRPL